MADGPSRLLRLAADSADMGKTESTLLVTVAGPMVWRKRWRLSGNCHAEGCIRFASARTCPSLEESESY